MSVTFTRECKDINYDQVMLNVYLKRGVIEGGCLALRNAVRLCASPHLQHAKTNIHMTCTVHARWRSCRNFIYCVVRVCRSVPKNIYWLPDEQNVPRLPHPFIHFPTHWSPVACFVLCFVCFVYIFPPQDLDAALRYQYIFFLLLF